ESLVLYEAVQIVGRGDRQADALRAGRGELGGLEVALSRGGALAAPDDGVEVTAAVRDGPTLDQHPGADRLGLLLQRGDPRRGGAGLGDRTAAERGPGVQRDAAAIQLPVYGGSFAVPG